MSEPKVFQRHGQRIMFDNEDLDFYLLQFLGYAHYDGAALGECLYTAAQIDEKNPASWVGAWNGLAEQVEARAEAAHNEGHRVSARKHYLRATTYYRTAAVLIPPGDELRANWQKIQGCFRRAASLFDPAIEPVQVPYEGTHLGGYFVHVSDNGQPRPTVIMIGGGECYAEEMYFWAGAPGRERGYQVLLVDLPAQAPTPFYGVNPTELLETRTLNDLVSGAVGAVIDYLLTRPDVDPDQLLVYGISGGGYMATCVAASETRVKAVAASTPIYDLHEVFEAEWPPLLRSLPGFFTDAMVKVAARTNPITRIVMQKLMWSAGADSVSSYMTEMKAAVVDPARISLPMLCMASANDPEACIRQTHELYEKLPNPHKKKVIFEPSTGADAHCQVNNPELAYATLFDWFDGVLAQQ
ncbi:MAG: prolyl oligopeptidase family serine peptidase [Chloroflexi bacterium]|nr:prolyl oligopeptidase family serine peptidase [Chloroflexota bacterium]